MRIGLLLMAGLLVSACVARQRPPKNPSQQTFEAKWQNARDWSDALREWSALARPSTAYPHTTVAFGREHADKPGLNLGVLPGHPDAAWREREVLSKLYRATFQLTISGTEFGRLALPESSYTWRIPSGFKLQGTPSVTTDPQNRLSISNNADANWVSARVVFRLNGEPTPTSLYEHGTEILVAGWGLALEPVSIELANADGAKTWLFLNESGPG